MAQGETRAILIERHGPPRVLAERMVRLREPGAGELQLSVEAAGVNFADLLMRAGLYGTVPPRPYSPGFEVAGRVARVGAGVSGWREGDRAVALMRHGGYAQDVIARQENAFPCPAALDAVHAAAIPVVFLTAATCLFRAAHAAPGESVLILGAAGGVGTAAVQLAVRHGLRVVGTAGDARKRAFVTDELGAEACFDSRGRWEEEVEALLGPRSLDVALDPVGGRATASCRRLLAPLGRLVFYGMSAGMPGDRGRKLSGLLAYLRTPRFHPLGLVQPNLGVFGVHLLHLGPREAILREMAAEIFAGVEAGQIRPVIDRVFTLDRDGAVGAHEHLHARRNVGKVVLAAAGPRAPGENR